MSRLVIGLLMVSVVAAVLIALLRFGDTAPAADDQWDYDMIAWHLSRGEGYAVGGADPAFLEPYAGSTDRRVLERIEEDRPFALTAYRPPLMPMLLAATYKVSGRHFWLWRVVSGLMFGLTAAGAGWLAWRVAGGGAGVATAALVAANPLVTRYFGKLLTESVVMLVVVALAWGLVRLSSTRRWRWVVLVGLAAGLGVLSRSLLVLWVPAVVVVAGVAMAWAGSSTQGGDLSIETTRRRGGWRQGLLAAGVCLAVSGAVCLPWWVRNVVVLDAMMPLGTQGGIGLPGGYSDAAVANGGAWVSAESLGIFDELEARWVLEGRDPQGLAWEKAKAKEGQAYALRWMRENLWLLPGLALQKAVTMWTSTLGLVGLVMAAAGIGTLVRGGWRRRWVWVLWGLVVANTLSVMATYATGGGRFMLPVYPVLAVLGTAGLARLFAPDLREHTEGEA